MAAVTRKLRIHGRVQGVFYRGWSHDQARSLGLSGWVRNRSDGTVEMLLTGEEEKVAAMINRAQRGPPAARVDRIDAEVANEPAPEGFEQRPTL